MSRKKKIILISSVSAVALVAAAFCVFFILKNNSKKKETVNVGANVSSEEKPVSEIPSSENSSEIISSSEPTVFKPLIAEIVEESAETFDGKTTDDLTRPTNNYLPKGTVDYITGNLSANGCTYYKLNCGRRIYIKRIIKPEGKYIETSKAYSGTLPDHNEIRLASLNEGSKTELVFNTLYKAPFFLDLYPQKYTNPAVQDYTVSSTTYEYVEIKFCYASVFEGQISFSESNPLFSRFEIVTGAPDYTVRLYLKKKGAFYGWDAYYNNSGQLVFSFKHPKSAVPADNEIGADLTGIKILVDAGHGGKDCGAIAGDGTAESERNLTLSIKIAGILKNAGATVYMTRTSDTYLLSPERTAIYRKYEPDLLISVHHDSSVNSNFNGYGAFYSTPFSQALAKAVYTRTLETGIYSPAGQSRTQLAWHYFYMARMTFCPSVLSENGYMSNEYDLTSIKSDEANNKKALAIARGTADWLLSVGRE